MSDDNEKPLSLTESIRKKILESGANPQADLSGSREIKIIGPTDQDDDLKGAEVGGRYILLERISEDETSITFSAEHKFVKRTFNVKLLRAHLCKNAEALKAFQKLAQDHAVGLNTDQAGSVADFGLTEKGRVFAVYTPVDPRDVTEVESALGSQDRSDGGLAALIRRKIKVFLASEL